MARARGIKPGFFRNADLVELSFEARLLFIGLWTIADRSGRLEDRPKQIKMELFPADNLDCDGCIQALADIGMVSRYEVDGKRYLQVTNFAKHQSPHKDEKASTLPDCDGNVVNTKQKPKKPDTSTVQAPCKEGANTVPIALTADCCYLTADSLKTKPQAAALDQPVLREPPPAAAAVLADPIQPDEPDEPAPAAAAAFADPIVGRAIELVALLKPRGAAIQASDPRVRAWAESGVTDTQALQSIEVANERRQEKADPRPINAGFLDAILGDIRRLPGPGARHRAGIKTPAPENFDNRDYGVSGLL